MSLYPQIIKMVSNPLYTFFLLFIVVLFTMPTFAVKSLSKKEIEKRIETARSCKNKTDCTGPIGKCPFGCSIYVNKESSIEIRELLATYNEKCVYDCTSIMGYDCLNGMCTAVEKSGEKYSGAKCHTNTDCARVDCDRFNGPIKSGYKAECVDVKNSTYPKECRCLCHGCH